MADKRKRERRSEKERQDLLERWSNTPAVNPHYQGATPADVARALLAKPDFKSRV